MNYDVNNSNNIQSLEKRKFGRTHNSLLGSSNGEQWKAMESNAKQGGTVKGISGREICRNYQK